jgi:hypothetical protein
VQQHACVPASKGITLDIFARACTVAIVPHALPNTVVLQWCYSAATVVLQWYYSGAAMVLKCFHSGVTMVLQWCHSGVTMLARACTVAIVPHALPIVLVSTIRFERETVMVLHRKA